MNYFIASDIHGSLYYCQKMLDCFQQEKAQRLILLGDVLYHGPRNDLPLDYCPKRVAEILNNYASKILAVRGNCDGQVDQNMLSFALMAPYSYIDSDDYFIFMSHGHIYNKDNHPEFASSNKKNIMICGHFHIPAFEKYDDFVYLNPGSISIPKEDSEHSYILFKDNTVYFKNLDGKLLDKYIL